MLFFVKWFELYYFFLVLCVENCFCFGWGGGVCIVSTARTSIPVHRILVDTAVGVIFTPNDYFCIFVALLRAMKISFKGFYIVFEHTITNPSPYHTPRLYVAPSCHCSAAFNVRLNASLTFSFTPWPILSTGHKLN